jgi:hypothetical protein
MPASARTLAVAAAVEIIAAYISRQRRPLIQARDSEAHRTSVVRLIGLGLLVGARAAAALGRRARHVPEMLFQCLTINKH